MIGLWSDLLLTARTRWEHACALAITAWLGPRDAQNARGKNSHTGNHCLATYGYLEPERRSYNVSLEHLSTVLG